MIHLVIFDFDDTITDNRLLDYKAFQIPNKIIGVKTPSADKITKARKKGILAKTIMKNQLKLKNQAELLEKFLLTRKIFLNSSESYKYLTLQKNLQSLLYLIKKNKIKCVICSAKQNKQIIINFLLKNKIKEYFSKIYLSKDLGFKINNSEKSNRILIKTSLLKKIFNDTNYSLDQIIYVGNSDEDFVSTSSLRIPFILFQTSYLPKLYRTNMIVVKNMNQLKKIIVDISEKH